VDVGGYRLHLHCRGEGSPAVVLLYGGGAYSVDFGLVQPGVARFTQACVYDRAGDAWSDPIPVPRTLRQNAYELHLLLEKAGRTGPYVLAGHSYGGLLARAYAAQFPKEVAGIVLIDSTHEDSQLMFRDKIARLSEMASDKPVPPVRREFPASKGARPPDGEKRPGPRPARVEPPYDRLPSEAQGLRRWAAGKPGHSGMDFLAEEVAEMHAARAKQAQPLGDIPLIVLTRGLEDYPKEVPAEERAALTRDRLRLQADLVRLSRNSKQVMASRSGHEIHLFEPDVVVAAIREVVEAARHKQRLPGTKRKVD
jgi:pimeloyl-ACP methyl ester carboxylesterase